MKSYFVCIFGVLAGSLFLEIIDVAIGINIYNGTSFLAQLVHKTSYIAFGAIIAYLAIRSKSKSKKPVQKP